MTCCTVWKFHDFPITQILREINFEYFRSAKSAILTHLEALNFDFFFYFFYFIFILTRFECWHLPKVEYSELQKMQNRHFLNFKSLLLWFHVKFDRQKNPGFVFQILDQHLKPYKNICYPYFEMCAPSCILTHSTHKEGGGENQSEEGP